MLQLLWLVPALPFAGFLVLALTLGRLPHRWVAVVGVCSVGLSAVVAGLIAADFIARPPAGNAFTQTMWTWMSIGDFRPGISFRLDALAVVFTLVITFVGFLIHLYSTEYMRGDEGFSRFFAYMNLFVGSMLTLVLADNLLLLFLGWEGVGLCSYLLIGFWYKVPYNGYAARKAFVVTRVGDTAFLIALFLLFTQLGTLDIQELLARATQQWAPGSTVAVVAAALILGGAVGKSAQLPLQTWLPDAMAGPTPVSALIHAATMVTAGVYLIARANAIFVLAPAVMTLVAIVGAATLVLAGFSALAQHDIKRILAYSTISQIGYMFLALGVGAWSAGIFHFMTHSFFKALLFLAAGAVITALHEERDIFKMGGLRKHLPLVFWVFIIGAASLSALPLVTAGYYSKDLILEQTWASPVGGPWLWGAGLLGAFVTGLYGFRLIFVAFFGDVHHVPERKPGHAIAVPLVVLAVLSVVGGFVELPRDLGDFRPFGRFVEEVLPAPNVIELDPTTALALRIIVPAVSLAGVLVAYSLYRVAPDLTAAWGRHGLGSAIHRLWFENWGFDWLYNTFFVQPFVWAARVNRADFIDLLSHAVAWLSAAGHRRLTVTQTGQLRWYAATIVLGAVIVVAIGVVR